MKKWLAAIAAILACRISEGNTAALPEYRLIQPVAFFMPQTYLPSVVACPQGSNFVDGCSGAPAGTAQFQTMLSGYAKRPPWNVAGVDYHVGIPSGTSLKDPSVQANLPTGATYSATGGDFNLPGVVVSSNNVTLDGFDFSLHGGLGISINNAVDGTVIKNSKFGMSASTGPVPIWGASGGGSPGSITIQNCEFYGNGFDNNQGVGMITVRSSSTVNVQYNYFTKSAGDLIDIEGAATANVEYNYADTYGTGTGHPDFVQYDGAVSGGAVSFNTIYQGQSATVALNTLMAMADNVGSVSGQTWQNNTVISTGPNHTSTYLFGEYVSSSNGVMNNNYYDPTGQTGATPFESSSGTNNTMTNFVNMFTGSFATIPSGVFNSDVSSAAASPASGTVTTGNAVSITLAMDASYMVTGTPTLSLNSGGTATYSSGSGTNSLVFTYTVGAGDTAANLAVTAVNLTGGATIKDAVGNPANTSGALVTFTGLTIN